MKKKIYIRADGSKEIGMGHLNRVFLLAHYLKRTRDIETILITKENESASRFLSSREINCFYIDSELSMVEEIQQLRYLSQTLPLPSLVLLDVLDFDLQPDYIDALRTFQAPLVAITDDSDIRIIDADLIINGNPCQLDHDYSHCRGRYLVGPKYFIMDDGYASVEKIQYEGRVKKIFISVGGSDHNNILFNIIDTLEKFGGFELRIVSSNSTGYLSRLKNTLKLISTKSELLVDIPSLINSWFGCDIAITAGGNTLFERIAVGMPGCTICQLVRQNEIASRFENLGANVNLGLAKRLDKFQLEHDLYRFLLNKKNHILQYRLSGNVIDGNGLVRVADELCSLI